MNQNYPDYQDQKYLAEEQLEDDDEDEEEPTHYNSCFAANNFLGLLLAVFQAGFRKFVSSDFRPLKFNRRKLNPRKDDDSYCAILG